MEKFTRPLSIRHLDTLFAPHRFSSREAVTLYHVYDNLSQAPLTPDGIECGDPCCNIWTGATANPLNSSRFTAMWRRPWWKLDAGGEKGRLARDTNDYQLDPSDAENLEVGFSASILQIHARMFALADKYDVGGLCSLASSKYSWELSGPNKLVEFFDSLHDVCLLSPNSKRELREKAIRHLKGKMPEIREASIFQQSSVPLLEELPEFARDLLLSYIGSPAEGHCSDCGWRPIEILQARCLGCRRGGVHTYR